MSGPIATPDSAPARRRPGRIALAARELQDGYGLTLVLTILTVGCLALLGTSGGGGLLSVCLTGATLLFALHTSQARPRVLRTAQVLVGAAILVSALAIVFGDGRLAEEATSVIGFTIAAAVPFVIFGRITRSAEITYRLVIGALVVYLLLGLCYSYVFELIALVTGTPFFVQTATPITANYIYFSYTTLSTVGYGDFTAATGLGQMVSISEALFGQLYLVSIVAIMVGNIGRSFRQVRDE